MSTYIAAVRCVKDSEKKHRASTKLGEIKGWEIVHTVWVQELPRELIPVEWHGELLRKQSLAQKQRRH